MVTAYLLTSTAVAPLYGKLSDIYGRRAMLLAAVGLFVAGSILCAVAPNMMTLILGRGLQGIGGGGILPLCQAVIADVVAPRERGRYQAYMGVVWVTSGVVRAGARRPDGGVPALVADLLDQRAARACGGAADPRLSQAHPAQRAPPPARRARRRADDGLGDSAAARADLGRQQLSVAVAANPVAARRSFVLSLLFGWRLVRAPEPFLPLTVLNNPVMRTGTTSASLAMGVSIGLTIFVPLYFELVHGLSATESGIALIPLALTTPGSLLSGQAMLYWRHYKRAPVVGLVPVSVALAFLIWRPDLPLSYVIVITGVVGTAIGLVYPVTTVSIQNAVPHYQVGIAMGALNFFRALASALAVAVMGAILLAGLGVAAQRGSALSAVATRPRP